MCASSQVGVDWLLERWDGGAMPRWCRQLCAGLPMVSVWPFCWWGAQCHALCATGDGAPFRKPAKQREASVTAQRDTHPASLSAVPGRQNVDSGGVSGACQAYFFVFFYHPSPMPVFAPPPHPTKRPGQFWLTCRGSFFM